MTTRIDPPWLQAARLKLNTREAPGAASNPTIMGWAKKLGTKVLGMAYNGDSVPWCGLFVAMCMAEAGIPAAPIAVRAKAWAAWGVNLDRTKLSAGAVLVFGRVGGGHVAFYVGEDDTHFHILGGNQGDKVSIVRKAKADLIAARWPRGVPVTTGPVRLAINGTPVSGSEA